MGKYKVLIVDDELIIRNSVQRIVSKYGHETVLAKSGQEGIEKQRAENPDIIFLDYRLPDLDGLQVLERIMKDRRDILVVIFSAYGTFKTVVDAIKLGAFDYLQKPFQNEEIALILMKAHEILKLRNEVRELRARSQKAYRSERIVAESPEMRGLLDLAVTVGRSGDTPVLIDGDTGVGKEVVAVVVHSNSRRSEGPFITVNCGAIPQDLMESELFGYEKGAFTGASMSGKTGFLDLAEGGSLFLDEVGELTPSGQVKLLRILEGKPYFRVGGVKEKYANVRLISATNRDLE
jgi:two-component system, NtrC family, response regulator AtoC